MHLLWTTGWCCTICTALLYFPWAVQVLSEPIKVDFSTCAPGRFFTNDDPSFSFDTVVHCCPVKPTRPIIDGLPPPSASFTRVRQAAQCTDAAYAAKLDKAYALLRALPDDDPRSLVQQWKLHCAYCGGSFVTSKSGSTASEGIDIHFGWLFYPWHRLFLYFHERILQSLLGDPTFSLNYWNWDNPYTVRDGASQGGACLKAGHDFPASYSNSSRSTYNPHRSRSAKGNGHLNFPDLSRDPFLSEAEEPLYNASAQEVIESNLNVLHLALVTGGTTRETFFGLPYRAGDPRGLPGNGGLLEVTAHASVHFWVGEDLPTNPNDMGALAFAARDPVFYAHHSNVDRLWVVWKSIGPLLGQIREDYADPDFLNLELLFYDENKDLRRVKVRDALDTRKLGYVYQQANDAAWMHFNQTRWGD